jgi:type II pantothenate kinase
MASETVQLHDYTRGLFSGKILQTPGFQYTDRIGLDIGGSLTKIVYTIKNRIFLENFATENIQEILVFLENLIDSKQVKFEYVVTTGGGSYKFFEKLNAIFAVKNSIDVIKRDEMECLIYGLDFLINDVQNEVFIMDHETEQINHLKKIDIKYPYMLVNIGSGVSVIRVDGPNCQFKRVGGSALGGGSLWGLLSLLTECKDYDAMLKLSETGDNTKVDMLVGDIYGTDYNNIGLKSTTIASSFGKVFKKKNRTTRANNGTLPNKRGFSEADIAKSLIYSISNNIGQISYLHANIHNVENIFFGGSYISSHAFIIKTLSYAINFWSKGEKQAHFLKHDGYIGAIGSFLTTDPSSDDEFDEFEEFDKIFAEKADFDHVE